MKSKYSVDSTYSWRKYTGAPKMLTNFWCINKLLIFPILLVPNLAPNIFLILGTPIFISLTILECSAK